MKILVLSDSHGALRYMEQAVEREMPEVIAHLGDRERDAETLALLAPRAELISLPGNCDWPAPDRPLTVLREFDGVGVMLTHGHPYGVKNGLLRLELAAREAGVQVVAFGHTHRPFCEEHNGLWLLNPGSCNGRLSYGLILTDGGRPRCKLI